MSGLPRTPYRLPNGYLIREAACADVPAIARVHVDSFRTTYPGILPASFLDSLSYERREESWRRDLCEPQEIEIAYVAEHPDGQVVGFATGGPEQGQDPTYPGEVYRLYLRQEHQGRGLGRALVATVVQQLEALGLHSLLIWVLAENPACGFYAALGGTPVKEKVWELQGHSLQAVAYGWPSTDDLLRHAIGQHLPFALSPSTGTERVLSNDGSDPFVLSLSKDSPEVSQAWSTRVHGSTGSPRTVGSRSPRTVERDAPRTAEGNPQQALEGDAPPTVENDSQGRAS